MGAYVKSKSIVSTNLVVMPKMDLAPSLRPSPTRLMVGSAASASNPPLAVLELGALGATPRDGARPKRASLAIPKSPLGMGDGARFGRPTFPHPTRDCPCGRDS